MSNPTTDTARALRRLLHFLQMASLELEGLEMDDRLKPEFRKRAARYRTKYTDWVARDIRTDMKNSKDALEVAQELTADKAKDLQLLIDLCLRFENIGEIKDEIEAAYRQQLKMAA